MARMSIPTPTLHTARLRLRPFTSADADALYALHSNAYVLRYWDAPPWREPDAPAIRDRFGVSRIFFLKLIRIMRVVKLVFRLFIGARFFPRQFQMFRGRRKLFGRFRSLFNLNTFPAFQNLRWRNWLLGRFWHGH